MNTENMAHRLGLAHDERPNPEAHDELSTAAHDTLSAATHATQPNPLDPDAADAELRERLGRATDASTADLAALHARLEAEAEADGILDVAFTTIDSPVGPLLLAATPAGLVRIAYEREGFDAVLDALAVKLSPRVLRAPRRLDAVARELDEYFAGRRRRFDVPLDYALSRGFRQRVQQQLPRIGYGRTESYAQLAATIGSPKAVRAVGSACATNPLPVVVPCHRVLRSDGTLGGYIGGLEAKSALLRLESAA